jgi:hypothetical protein
MRQAHFPGPGDAAATDETGVGDGVVGRAEGVAGKEGPARGEEASDGVELGGLQGFVEGERRKDGGEAAGEHGLARTRRPHQQDAWDKTPAKCGYSPSADETGSCSATAIASSSDSARPSAHAAGVRPAVGWVVSPLIYPGLSPRDRAAQGTQETGRLSPVVL